MLNIVYVEKDLTFYQKNQFKNAIIAATIIAISILKQQGGFITSLQC